MAPGRCAHRYHYRWRRVVTMRVHNAALADASERLLFARHSIGVPHLSERDGRIRSKQPTGDQGGTMAGKFEVYKDAAGKFRFRLKAGNGEIIAASEAYENR